MHNSFNLQQYTCYTILLKMFRAARCSSSGGPIVSPQPLVSSPWKLVNDHILTHLCLTFHYWNGSDMVVIYFLLCKVIPESDFSPMSASLQGTCYLVVHRVSRCCRYWRAGSLSKSDENFSEDFFTTIRQVNITSLHYIPY